MRYLSPLFYSIVGHIILGLLLCILIEKSVVMVTIQRSPLSAPLPSPLSVAVVDAPIHPIQEATSKPVLGKPTRRRALLSLPLAPVITSITPKNNERIKQTPTDVLSKEIINNLRESVQRIVSRVPKRLRSQIENSAVVTLSRISKDKWQARIEKSSGLPMLDKQILKEVNAPGFGKRISGVARDKLTLNLNSTFTF